MSLQTHPGVKTQMQPAPNLRQARFDDYDGIARLGLANSLQTQPYPEWRSMWLDNPAWQRLASKWPIGWVLETSSGEIVGSFLNIPSRYKFRGQDLVCAASRAWAVAASYRGYGPWLIDEYFNQPNIDLTVMTTTGPMALPVVGRLAARIPVGNWDLRSWWMLGYVTLAANKLRRLRVPLSNLFGTGAGWALTLKDVALHPPLAKLPSGYSVDLVADFDARFDKLWEELIRQHPERLLADRSSQALSGHYGTAMRDGRLWIFTAQRSQLSAYCVLTVKGTGIGRFARIVDYQTIEGDELLPGLVRAALQHCIREGIHVLENLGRGVPKMRAVDRSAPYSGRLPSWRFFYRACDETLDRELRSARFWDPSAYDGDASIG